MKTLIGVALGWIAVNWVASFMTAIHWLVGKLDTKGGIMRKKEHVVPSEVDGFLGSSAIEDYLRTLAEIVYAIGQEIHKVAGEYDEDGLRIYFNEECQYASGPSTPLVIEWNDRVVFEYRKKTEMYSADLKIVSPGEWIQKLHTLGLKLLLEVDPIDLATLHKLSSKIFRLNRYFKSYEAPKEEKAPKKPKRSKK